MNIVDKFKEAPQTYQGFMPQYKNFIKINTHSSNNIETQVSTTTPTIATHFSSKSYNHNFTNIFMSLHFIMLKLLNNNMIKFRSYIL